MTLEKSHDGRRLTVDDDYNKCHLIHCVTRDLTSLCQTLCSLIPVLQADKSFNCPESYVRNLGPDMLPSNLHKLAINLLKAVEFLSRSKLYNLEVALPQLSTDFAEIYAQMLSALRCFLGWSVVRNETELKPLIENVAFTLLPPSNKAHEPKIVTLAAGMLEKTAETAILRTSPNCDPHLNFSSTSFKYYINGQTYICARMCFNESTNSMWLKFGSLG